MFESFTLITFVNTKQLTKLHFLLQFEYLIFSCSSMVFTIIIDIVITAVRRTCIESVSNVMISKHSQALHESTMIRLTVKKAFHSISRILILHLYTTFYFEISLSNDAGSRSCVLSISELFYM